MFILPAFLNAREFAPILCLTRANHAKFNVEKCWKLVYQNYCPLAFRIHEIMGLFSYRDRLFHHLVLRPSRISIKEHIDLILSIGKHDLVKIERGKEGKAEEIQRGEKAFGDLFHQCTLVLEWLDEGVVQDLLEPMLCIMDALSGAPWILFTPVLIISI